MDTSALMDFLEIQSVPHGGRRAMVPLNADELMASAAQLSGLNDFCSSGWEEGFRTHTSLFDENPRLKIIDRLVARAETLRQLNRRLSLVARLRGKPAIASERIDSPIFITGSPRTGTTILFELLFQDPALRAPFDFEIRSPLLRGREYFDQICLEHQALQNANPKIKPLHEVKPDLPAECALIMAVSLAYALKNDGGAITWINRKNLKDAYAFHKITLQSLQHESTKKRWLLKCPFHIFSLPELIDAYPDAKIIYMHRDQVKAMSSLMTLYGSLFNEQFDSQRCRMEIDLWSDAHESVIQLRANKSIDNRIYDVRFTDLMANPLDVIEHIYDHLQMELTDEARSRIESYVTNRPRFKYGAYQCKPEDFELSRAEIAQKFRSYNQHYGITEEL